VKSQLQKNEMKHSQFIKGAEGQKKTIHTTIGDLVVAVSDRAFEIYGENRKGYLLAGLALEAILGRGKARGRTIRVRV